MLSQPLQVASLTCERRTEPLGVDVLAPRLAWMLKGDDRNRCQTAYEVRAGTRKGTADLWSSGKVESEESGGVAYAGRPLSSSEQVYWQVRVWDETGRASRWSRSGSWTMGVLRSEDWKGKWIGHAGPVPETLLLRREFRVHGGLRRAVIHVAGLGQYEMRMNGRKVGTDLLTPGWTDLRKTVLYDTYDVTKLLRTGVNAVGLLLGNGMDNVHEGRYTKLVGSLGPHKALAQIRLEYGDGTWDTIGTDDRWATHPGPITFSSVFGGEDLDLRREPKGWSKAGFSDVWSRAKPIDAPAGRLQGTGAPPVRAFEILKPKTIRTIRPGVEIVDLGQNAALMVRMKLSGSAGSVVRITPAELLKKDGTIDRASVGGGEAYWQVTLDGTKTAFFPRFFYHGCRYLQVERSDGARVDSIEGVVVGSSAPEVGEFACSSDRLNRIHTLIRWAQRSNTMSVLTDCPHRERLGWLEQYHLNGPSLRYEHDLSTLFEKCMGDMADAQRPDGLVPDIAPEYTVFSGGFVDSPEWGSAVVLVPWQQYAWHRDRALLERRYDTMKRYVEYLRGRAKDGVVSHGLGDWYDLGPRPPGFAQLTPIALTATAFYFQDVAIMADVATLLGRSDDAIRFAAEGENVRFAFNKAFLDPAKGYYAAGSQAANAIPLVMGLVEPPNRATVLAQLVRDVQEKGNTAGDVGYRYVLRALADGGRSDVVFAMVDQSTRPGYGYQLAKGATSLTEAWDANPSSSQNHFMLGQIVEWFYGDLAGIAPVEGFIAFAYGRRR